MKKLIFSLLVFSLGWSAAMAQSVGINSDGTSPNSSAMLDVKSTTKGLLIPRVALTGSTDVATVTTPATSLLIYNTATTGDVTPGYYYYNGAAWLRLASGTIPVASGGTGATTLTGYIMGTGTTAMTASATIPAANISGNISGNAANVTGTVAVASGGTGTATGSITGTGALTFTAGTSGGANQNVTLTPSGTGYTLLNGNVGIGTATPVGKLEVIDNGASSGGNTARFYNPGLADGGLNYVSIGKSFNNNECALMGFSKQATISRAWLGVTGDDIIGGLGLTVQKGGNVGIGDKSPAYRFSAFNSINGEYVARIFNGNNSGTAHGLLIRAGSNGTPFGAVMIGFANIDGAVIGSITQDAAFTVSYNTSSDRRLKNNIVNTHFGINDLMKIQVRDYVYKADAGKALTTGFIAQELYEIFPNAVTKPAKAEDMWSIDYGKVTPLLVKAIQDQQATIEAQQKQIDELKRMVEMIMKK